MSISALPAYDDFTNESYTHSIHQNSLPSFEHRNMEQLKNCIQIGFQPKNYYKLTQGEDLIIKVLVDAPFDLLFQWFHMSTPLPEETGNVLMIPEVKRQHEGYYACRITSKTPTPVVIKTNWTYVSIGVDQSKFHATDKIALLIANVHYANHKRLPAAARDIQVLTDILQNELNFKTLSFVNLSFNEMHKALEWLISMSKKGCYCVFYFGGHGFENDGMCYMVPTDAPSPYGNGDCINAHMVLEDYQRRCGPSLLLILLDTCRKRNFVDSPVSQNSCTFLPNVVIAYATTEKREAYEEIGVKYGIFADSLRKHLAMPARVNHMLSAVQDEVKKSRCQIAEVKSTLAENRCLTDRIIPELKSVEVQSKWLYIHGMANNEPLQAQIGGRAIVEVSYKSLLTNKIKISVRVLKILGNCTDCRASIDLRSLQGNKNLVVNTTSGNDITSPDIVPFQSSVHVANLQKLKDRLPLTVIFQYYCTETGKRKEQSYQEFLQPRIIDFWS